MKMVLYAAISADGFIAREDGDSDWVKDDELFDKTVQEFGCVVLGHNTFRQFEGELYPIEGVQHLILAHTQEDSNLPNVHFVSSSEEAIQKAKNLSFDQLLVIGGGQCNGSFAKAGLLDEVWLDEHPLKLGRGIKLLGEFIGDLGLEPISTKKYPDFTHKKFKVKK